MARWRSRRAAAWLVLALLGFGVGCSGTSDGERMVRVGFYAFFEPVSAAADPDPDAAGFGTHAGYEADLLTAKEMMDGLGLRFARTPVAEWPGIWLLPSRDDVDMVGGGINILDSRRLDADGNTVVAFAEPHIEFRQSLLIRSGDVGRLPSHDALRSTDVVGVLPATTGEARLLQLIGIADAHGRLAAGTQVHTPARVVTVESDGALSISAAQASSELEHRTRLVPADPARPTVVYLGEESGEAAWTGGRRWAHGAACSICAATRSSTSSRPGAATSCTPMGRPSGDMPSAVPSGTEMAGWPLTLNCGK